MFNSFLAENIFQPSVPLEFSMSVGLIFLRTLDLALEHPCLLVLVFLFLLLLITSGRLSFHVSGERF